MKKTCRWNIYKSKMWHDRLDGWLTAIGTFLSLSFSFIVFGQLNVVWSALFLFTIYFLLLIRCSLERARSSAVIAVCSSSQKESEIIKIEWHLHFSTICPFLTWLARLSVLSLSSRSPRRWFRRPTDRTGEETRRESGTEREKEKKDH